MRVYLTIAVGAVFCAACATRDRDVASDSTAADSPAAATGTTTDRNSATAVMHDSSGRDLGTLTLTDSSGTMSITGRLTGLAPGEHGVHLHMVGRCDAPSFESAGGHWNPTNRHHGSQNPEGPHLGDLPNVTVGADSTVTVQMSLTGNGSLRGGTNMLLDADGAAVVVHSGPDDYRTDPSGGSGSRVACGVISGT